MRVAVYWNLHRDCFSVRACEGPCRGRVIAHRGEVTLVAARFVVRTSGRRKVIATRCKSVHAWVTGELAAAGAEAATSAVTYNPYKHETFVHRETGAPIVASPLVRCATRDGKPWVTAA